MLKIIHFAPDHTSTELTPQQVTGHLDVGGTLWIDLAAPTDEEFASISTLFDWHALAIEDCRIENHLPKVDDYEDYLLLVFHAVDVGPNLGAFGTREIEVFLSRNYLVTHHREPIAATDELLTRSRQNPGLASKGPAFLLFLLLESMSQVFLPYLDRLDDRIEDVEAQLLDRPSRRTLQEIYELRRDVISMRRVVMPQLEVMRRLGRPEEFSQIPAASAIYFRDIYDDLFRVIQTSDSYRELLAGALDSYRSALSNEMNQVMKVLTIFASIFIPLTFLVGVWGMNFRHMPELSWRLGYPFALVSMLVVGLGLAWFFKRRRWL